MLEQIEDGLAQRLDIARRHQHPLTPCSIISPVEYVSETITAFAADIACAMNVSPEACLAWKRGKMMNFAPAINPRKSS